MRTWTYEIKIWSQSNDTEFSTEELLLLLLDKFVVVKDGTMVEVDLISDIESLI